MQVPKKKKYTIEQYISPNRGNSILKNINSHSQLTQCICGRFDGKLGMTCFKCHTIVHFCIENTPNRDKLYECACCLNRSLDPIYQVKKVYVESYFKTQNIFEYQNQISFQFCMTPEDQKFIVEVRGLKPGSTSLSWPMQGSFYLNEQPTPFYELKPLLSNSNRKLRREQYFSVPSQKLKIGLNFIRFRIFSLDRQRFTAKFQYEDRGLYYMSINLVSRLNPQDLVNLTFKQRRIEQKQSLQLLSSGQVEITSNKVCLICPYTRDRIKVPIRGKYCKHFSCVCLQTLILSHMTSRYWGCPICEQKITEPVVDMWIYQMLRDNQSGSDVLVNIDGTYSWIKNQKAEIMDLDDEDEDVPIAQKTVSKKIVQQQTVRQAVQQISVLKQHPKSNQIQTIEIIDQDLPERPAADKSKTRSLMVAKLKQKMLEASEKQKLERQSIRNEQKPLWGAKIPSSQLPSRPVIIIDIPEMKMNQITPEQLKKLYFRQKSTYSRKTVRYFNENKNIKRLLTKIG